MAPKRGLYRGIAQLVEYRSPKPWVAGSNPPAPVKNALESRDSEAFFLFILCDLSQCKVGQISLKSVDCSGGTAGTHEKTDFASWSFICCFSL